MQQQHHDRMPQIRCYANDVVANNMSRLLCVLFIQNYDTFNVKLRQHEIPICAQFWVVSEELDH